MGKDKKIIIWHPESPGIRITVYRNWFQRLIYPKAFATLTETIDYHIRVLNNK